MTHTVREGRPADLPALRAIQAAALAEPWPELLALAADGPPLLLVCASPDPVGYALAIRGGDDGTPAGGDPSSGSERDTSVGEDGERAAYLVELAVAPPRQGEGCGSALLSELVARLRAADYDLLWVTARETDGTVRAFYRERGFEERRRLPDRYESGDGVLLVRRID